MEQTQKPAISEMTKNGNSPQNRVKLTRFCRYQSVKSIVRGTVTAAVLDNTAAENESKAKRYQPA